MNAEAKVSALVECLGQASSVDELESKKAEVEELEDPELVVVFEMRKAQLEKMQAAKADAQRRHEHEMKCMAIVRDCHNADELRTTVLDVLRPMMAGYPSLPDKLSVVMRDRYVSLTRSKGNWTSKTIAKLLRERPKLSFAVGGVELSHVGVAQQILAKLEGDLRTIVEKDTQSWIRWDGCRWDRLANKQVGALVGECIDDIKEKQLADPGLDAQDVRAVVGTLGHVAFNHGVTSAMGFQRSAHVSADELNTHSEYLAVDNGAVHLPTGELVANRDLLLTVRSKTTYNPDAKCPTFLECLRTTFQGRQEDIDYYEFIMGYTVLGSPKERAVFFHLGEGNNGKSLLLSAICHALGAEHAPVLNFRLIASEPGASISGDANAASPAQYKLRYARLGYIDELPKGGVMRDASLKLYAGGARIDARLLNNGLDEFDQTAALQVLCNVQMAIRGALPSTWHRVVPVAYRAIFKDDPTLPGKLKDEAEGVLAWLVRCAQKYLKARAEGQGLRDCMPASAREELETMKRAQDPLADWLEDCCELVQDGGMPSVEGWKAFMAYHHGRDSELPMSVRTDRLWFERMLSIKGVRDSRGNLVLVNSRSGKEKRQRGFYGIQLKDYGWITKAQMDTKRSAKVRAGNKKVALQLEDPSLSKKNGLEGQGWMREAKEVEIKNRKDEEARKKAEALAREEAYDEWPLATRKPPFGAAFSCTLDV